MNTKELVDRIQSILDDEASGPIRDVRTFEDLGVGSTNPGFVVRTSDGSEFQFQCIQSK